MPDPSLHCPDRPDVHTFLDYRVYLAELYAFHKQRSACFSYRYFSRKAGFASPNFLKLVIDGQRNLTANSIAKIAKGFGLKKGERDYFESLVFMNQAVSHEEKNHYYRRLLGMTTDRKLHTLAQSSYEYFSRWYYPAIREMVACGHADMSAAQIADRLMPGIPPQSAAAALQLLEKLGLIQRSEQGPWRQTHADVTTGPEIRSLVIANYHREMLNLAAESLERFPPEERDISSVSVGIHRDRMGEFKQRLREFRKALLQLAATDEDPDRVVQINIQMFPLTR